MAFAGLLVLAGCGGFGEESSTDNLPGAVGRNDLPGVRGFLEEGIDPDTVDSAGVPSLVGAAAHADAAIVVALLNAGADPDVAAEQSGETALMAAAARRGPTGEEIARLLVDADADVCLKLVAEPLPARYGGDLDGLRPDEIAAVVGNVGVVDVLADVSRVCSAD